MLIAIEESKILQNCLQGRILVVSVSHAQSSDSHCIDFKSKRHHDRLNENLALSSMTCKLKLDIETKKRNKELHLEQLLSSNDCRIHVKILSAVY